MSVLVCPHCQSEHTNKKDLRACIFSHLDEETEEEVEPVKEEVASEFFVKKPVVIQAYQTDEEMEISTPEGTMKANAGDWIITGVAGEQYPCKPEIFEKSYDRCNGEMAPVKVPLHLCPPELKYLSVNQVIDFRMKALITPEYELEVQDVEFVRR